MVPQKLDELFAAEMESIEATEPASHAQRRMDTSEARSLLVTNDGQLVGILRRNSLLNVSGDDLERPAADYMSADVPKVTQNQSVEEAHAALGGDINIEQVPVVDESGNLVGVVNRADLLAAAAPVAGDSAESATEQLPLVAGMPVKDSSGSKLGTLAHADLKSNGGVEFLNVEHGLIFKKEKRLPGDVVSRVEDGDLVLSIGSIEFGMIKDVGDE